MRKFRGLTKKGKWVYGWYIHRSFRDWIEVTLEGRATPDQYGLSTGITFEVISESVGQFTGLKDKNGTEIYEGDIARIIHKTHQFCGMVGKIHYLSASFWITGCLGGTDHWIGKWIEVIGNIHTTPELLENENG